MKYRVLYRDSATEVDLKPGKPMVVDGSLHRLRPMTSLAQIVKSYPQSLFKVGVRRSPPLRPKSPLSGLIYKRVKVFSNGRPARISQTPCTEGIHRTCAEVVPRFYGSEPSVWSEVCPQAVQLKTHLFQGPLCPAFESFFAFGIRLNSSGMPFSSWKQGSFPSPISIVFGDTHNLNLQLAKLFARAVQHGLE